MHDEILDLWNSNFGKRLPLSKELLEYSISNQQIEYVDLGSFKILLKINGKASHIHLAAPTKKTWPPISKSQLKTAVLEKFRVEKLFFGGGDFHIFPGVPKIPLYHEFWLKCLNPWGPEVMDFEGAVQKLLSNVSSIKLLPCQNKEDERELLSFVQTEFPGRWYREILFDSQKGMLEHYYSLKADGIIQAYVRLYGWRPDYWAPGVYFSGPGKNQGGLGPIGVAINARGKGIGSQVLKQSWQILSSKGIKKVRVDWTTEREFYERVGLEITETYQPARLDLIDFSS